MADENMNKPDNRPIILIVDDTPTNIQVLAETLRSDYRIKVASSGKAALDIAGNSELRPDLILLDVMMPEMDGYEVCRRLKQAPETKNIPVIFVTAKSDVVDEEHGLRLGAVDYITKPIKGGIVLRRVGNLLEREQMRKEIEAHRDLLEVQVAKRTADLLIAKEDAEAAKKELEEFSYSMSHDMRTPLRALDGFSKILLDEHSVSLDDEGKRLVKVLRDNAQHMGRLVDDILHFLSTGRQIMKFSSVDISKLASEIVTELQTAAPARRLRLEIGTLPPAWGDRDMIREVLQNLLANTVKFSPVDAEVLIEICSESKNEENIYSVTDHGIGFDMRYKDKLFKVFERVHQTGQYEGSGIGLALVKRIITRHGGRAWAEGKVNEGATIYFSIPARAISNKAS